MTLNDGLESWLSTMKKSDEAGQPIYHYVVDVVYQKKGRAKVPTTYKQFGLELVSRAKTLAHLNRDPSAIDAMKAQVQGGHLAVNFRAFNIKEQKYLSDSFHHREKDYPNEFS